MNTTHIHPQPPPPSAESLETASKILEPHYGGQQVPEWTRLAIEVARALDQAKESRPNSEPSKLPGQRVKVTITGPVTIGQALTMVSRAMTMYFSVLSAAQPASQEAPLEYRWYSGVSE